MDEEITIIDSNTRNEKIKNFFIDNKKKLIIGALLTFLTIGGYFLFEEMKEQKKIELANNYNLIKINFNTEDKQKTINQLIKLVKENDKTYSPLALYYLIDNNLINNVNEINDLFNEVINKANLDEEIKNLLIYKKALINSDVASGNDLLQILNPIINSESIWKSHALYLVAEYFYYNDEKEKSKEFFNQIIMLTNSNNDIKIESQKRINRDFSE